MIPNAFVGASAAAPIESGIIALMLEKNANLFRVQSEPLSHNEYDIASF